MELFQEDGSEKVEIDCAAMGRKPDTVQHGLTAAIKRLDLDDAIRVSLLDGGEKLLLRRRSVGPPKPQPAVTTPQVGSGDPTPDEQYRWMVDQVIHRGFRRMGFELDESDADPEMVKRGLERTISRSWSPDAWRRVKSPRIRTNSNADVATTKSAPLTIATAVSRFGSTVICRERMSEAMIHAPATTV